MRTGHRFWRSLAIIPALLLALALSACNVSLGAGTTGTPISPDKAATGAAGTPTTSGQGGCAPQTKHDNGSSDGQYTYLSPKQLWTLYGVEPLLKQCYTGRVRRSW